MPDHSTDSGASAAVRVKEPEPLLAPSGDRPGEVSIPLEGRPTTIRNVVEAISFRFVFAYFCLYLFPFPINTIPVDWLTGWWDETLHAVVPWVGKYVLGLGADITVFTNGSGDTTYDYVLTLCMLVVSALAALVWTLVDRRRRDFSKLNAWLRVYVRFALGMLMVSYGAVKVIKSQFPDPSLDRLIQPFGDASPMGLLWTFMGASTGYNVFAGSIEMLGGLLVFMRRTTTLGALVCAGAMANVFALNMSYDVPVKLLSFHMLAMGALLVLPDVRRLADFFVFNRSVAPAPAVPLFQSVRLRRVSLVLAALFVAYSVGLSLYQAEDTRASYIDPAQQSPLRGIWNVDGLTVDGVERPPLLTDESRWRRIVFDYPQTVAVQLMSDSRVRYALALDDEAKTLAMTKRDDPSWKASFTYDRTAPDAMTLDGTLEGHQIHATLRRLDESAFQLTSRGFHWINERPFNR